MALITKMHRCAFCGSSEVTVSEMGPIPAATAARPLITACRPPMWRLSTGF